MGIIRIHHECEDGIVESVPRITDWHHEACRVMTNGDIEGRIFYPIFTQIMDYFSCLQLNTSFCIEKHEKGFQKILNRLRCDMVTSFQHYHDVTDRCAASVKLVMKGYILL